MDRSPLSRLAVRVLGVILLAVVLLIATPLGARLAGPSGVLASDGDDVQAAWQQAERVGTYEYSSNVVQTTTPALTLANVGRSPIEERLYIEGAVDRPNDTMQMKMWSEDGSIVQGAGAIELQVTGGEAQGRVNGGDWQPVDGAADLFAPGHDPLGFLNAARNVSDLGTETRDFPTGTVTFTRYGFTLDGPTFARFMRDSMEADLARKGELPVGTHLDVSPVYAEMTGSGEIWVASDGLPLRLTIDLAFPATEEEQISAQLVSDFQGWGAVPGVAGWLSRFGNLLTPAARGLLAAQTMMLLAMVGFAFIVVRHRSSRKVYVAVVSAMILSLVSGPLMQTQQAYAFSQRMESRQATQEGEREARATAEAQMAAPTAKSWNPHNNPLASGSAAPLLQATSTTTGTQTYVDDGTDSDSDGLTNVQEQILESNPNVADTDSDGLTDGLEVLELGTTVSDRQQVDSDGNGTLEWLELGADSDGDGLNDGLEVVGFLFAGQRWYLNPMDVDTNGDGLADGTECDDSTTTTLTCADTDGDQTPNVFDLDDDADGVPDVTDLDATAVVGNLTDGLTNNTFRFGFSDLAPEAPVYVDFQLRPTNPDHLWYTLNVLDWPTNDREGQIQRILTDTFGTSGQLSDGDMRLVPMLEISIPYENGGYGNLPTLASAPPITPSTPFEQWLDQDELDQFGISVRRLDVTGTLQAYVPLTLVREADGNNPLAFSARMFYRPKDRTGDNIADWGALQSARLLWMVEVMTDKCTDTPDSYEPTLEQDDRRAKWCEGKTNWVSSGSSIQHVYEDDWYLTGLRVREDQGMKVAVALQDPTYSQSHYTDLNTFHEGALWSLAQGLEYGFLSGAGDDNGQRSMTVDTIAQRWDRRQNGSVSAEQRWNIPQDALLVERYNYEHQGLIATLAMSDTPDLLDEFFTPVVNAGVAMSPTLLFAHEEQFRALSLTHRAQVQPTDGATWQSGVLQGNGLTMAVTAAAAPSVTRAGIKWAPFRYDSGTSEWESYPLDEYWDVYEDRWAATLDAALDTPEEVEAGTALLSAYYITLAHGLETLVELAGQAAEAAYQRGDTELVNTLNAGGTDLEALSGILDIQMLSFSSLEMGKRALNAVLRAVAVSEPIVLTQTQLELADIAKILNPDRGLSVGGKEWSWLSDVDGTDLNTVKNGETYSALNLGKHGPWLKKAQVIAGGMAKLNDGLSIAGTALALGWVLYDIGYGDEDEERHWQVEIAFNSINVALATVNLVAATSHLVLTVGIESVRSGVTTLKALSNVYAAARIQAVSVFKSPSAIIGVVIATVASISFFIYQVVSEGIAFVSLAFDKALAAAIATIIVAVILLAIAAIPVVGPFISAIIGIIDALILVICAATDTSGEDNFVCYGIAGMLSKVVEWAIYDQSPIVDMENSDRLNLSNFEVEVVNPAYGFTQGTQLDVTMDVNTALYMDELRWSDVSPFIVYRWQFADTFLKQATFDYALQSMTQTSLHDDLGLNDMRDEWQEPDSSGWAADANFVAATPDVQGRATYLSSGINASPSQFYLAEGYSIPVQECAMIPIPYGPIIVPTPVCWIRSYKDTSHMNAGSTIGFDIFPRTLDGFYTLTAWNNGYFLGWDGDFPVLRDADGDNLLSGSFNGPDPDDSKPDTDEDGLSDYLELAVGSDPAVVDTDGDGLTDYQDLQEGTDPRKLDTDRDGLMDGEEAYHPDWLDSDGDGNRIEWIGGWEIVYAFVGDTPVRTRVWSNPLQANEDNDDYLDAQELAYGLHPQVQSLSNIFDIASEIQGSNVVRPGTNVAYEVALNNNLKGRAMEGLLGVDFPPALQNPTINPQNFQLLPRQGITLTGQVTVDPAITTSQAVSLTNIAGAVPTTLADEIARRTLWLHLDESSGTQFADASLQGHGATCQGSTCPQLNQAGYRQRAVRLDGTDDRIAVNHSVSALGLSTGSYTVLAWVQPADQRDDATILTTSDGSLSLRIEGDHPSIRINGTTLLQSESILSTGNWHRLAWRYDRGSNRYSIFLNGVLLETYDNAATPQLEGDETVIIGGPSPFFFGNMDEVEIFPYALSNTEIATGARGAQVFYYDFDQAPSETQSWVDNSAYANPIICHIPGSDWDCPGFTTDGAVGEAYRFGTGSPAYTNLLRVGPNPNLNLSRGNGAFSTAMWVKPVEGRGWVLNNPDVVIDRSNGSAGVIEVEFGPSSSRCSARFTKPYTGQGADPLEGWHHVAVTFDGQRVKAYLDGELLGENTSCAGRIPEPKNEFFIGHREEGQLAAPNGNGYSGWLDELRLYDYSLTPGQVEDLFWISLPSVEMRFDEAPGRTTVRDSSLSGITGLCTGTGCPVTGVPGRINQAALFDGTDDSIQIGTAAQLGMVGRSFTVSAWVRADGSGNRPILGTNNAATTAGFALGLTNGMPYVTMRGLAINTTSALTAGSWHHLVWRYEYNPASNIKRGDLYVNGTLAGSLTSLDPLTGGAQLLYAGQSDTSFFSGLLDHLQIFRHALTAEQRAELATQAPIINLHMDTRVPAVSLYDRTELTNPRANAGAAGFSPTCSSTECPQVGTTGRMYQGQQFDGENDLLTIPSNVTLGTLTMGMWVKPTEQKSKWQTLFAVEGNNFSNIFNVRRSRAGLYIKPNSNTLHVASYCISGNLLWENMPNGQDVAPLFEDRWNHVMLTYDGSETVVYINGLEAFSSTSTGLCLNNATPRLGDSPNVGDGTGFARFAGEMDEVVLYGEALSQDDMRELVTYQGNWFDVAYGHNIVVDADAPTFTFAPPNYLRTDQTTALSVSAWDATSAIASVTYEVDHPDTGTVESGTLQQEGAVWLFHYLPSAGEQRVKITVTDQAGNQSRSDATIIGDGTAPAPTLETDGSVQPLDVTYDEANETWTVFLRILVNNGDAATNSLFTNNTVTVTVLDGQGVPVGEPPLEALLSRRGWQLAYPFPTRPNGNYTVRLAARDSVGNIGTLERTISIDGTAPQAQIGFPSDARTALNIGQVLTGTVVEPGAASGVNQVEISLVPAGWDNRSSAAWLETGLRWHLPLDESRFDTANNPTQQFHDATGRGNDATCGADACPLAAVPGTYANAVGFDGGNDLLTAPISETLDAFTVGMWVQPGAGSTGEQPFLALVDEGGVTDLALAYNTATQQFLAREGSTATLGTTTGAPDSWHHVMLSVQEDAATLFVNGQQAATFTTAVGLVTNGSLRLGGDGGTFFAGQLDDALLYNRALPLNEVRQHWRGFSAVLRLGFDEHAMLDGVALPDASRYEHTPVLHLNADLQRMAVTGIVGAGALPLNGVGDYIEVPSHPAFDLNDGQFTQMAWLSLPTFAAGSYYPIFSNEDDVNPSSFPYLGVVDDGRLRASFNGEEYVTQPLLAANAWNFVATTFDGTTYRFYVNGTLAEETTLFEGETPPADAQQFNIGRGFSSSTQYGPVTLDEVALFRQALSAQEIAAYYQQAWQPTTLSTPPNGVVNAEGLRAAQATVGWSYTVPTGLGESVEIRLRTTDANGNVSFGAQGNERWSGAIVEEPQAITLAGFAAIPQTDAIRILWETASEVDNLGFNLRRATSPDAEDATLLNTELIASETPGSAEGASYEWVDSDVEITATYYYWLEAVDVNGDTNRYGPVSASLEAPTVVTITNFGPGDASPLKWHLVILLLVALASVFVVRQRRVR